MNTNTTQMKPFICNVAAVDVSTGNHKDPGADAMLIQIMDPCSSWWPDPKFSFKETHRFEFLDAERIDDYPDEAKITTIQADEIVSLLQQALSSNRNVIVHCMAGICRSGAVTEVGTMMGFEDTGAHRIPNLLVKHSLMKALGWTYD